ncbi:MAG TPA: hypothetical protein DF698_08455 [Candidatus Atribacteria bacterium]|nr:hypothetical protein [Candidatus Atribacteria bacterium]
MDKACQAYIPQAYQLQFREIDKPVTAPGKVIVEIVRIGICGSDIHAFKGKHPLVSFPLIQGHELSGFIVEVGEGINDYKMGDFVTIEPAIGCGNCSKCQQGLIAQCDQLQFIGGNIPGGGNQYLQVDPNYIVRYSSEVSLDDAAMTEPLAVAIHAVNRVPNIKDQKVFIAGGGTIGLLVAQVCRLQGAKEIIISEMLQFRSQVASILGFKTVFPDDQLENQVKDIMKASPSVVFECVGMESPLNSCIHLVERGGYVIVAGVYEKPPRVDMVLVQDKEINMLGSLMYSFQEFREAAEFIKLKKIILKPLQTNHFPFHQWVEAYRFIEDPNNSFIKVFIDINAHETGFN